MCCLPLLLFPHILPLHNSFSSPSALITCPKNLSCLSLMVLRKELLYPVISITSAFVFLFVHEIFIILRMNNISTASSRCSVSLVWVQHSQPYRRMDLILPLVKMHFMLLKVALDCLILFLISVSLLPTGVIVQPRYLKVLTCLILSHLQAMLHCGITTFFRDHHAVCLLRLEL